MLYTTTETLAGKTITEVIGFVSGNIVHSKHIGRDIMASLKTVVGGELKGYTEMLTEARQEALNRMLAEAKNLNADAVISVRFVTSTITHSAAEIMVYGTAVKLEKME